MAYPYNEILFAIKSNEDLIHAVICIKPWKYHAKWKKLNTKCHYCIISFLWKVRTGKSIEIESRLVLPGAGKRRTGEGLLKNRKSLWKVMKMFWNYKMLIVTLNCGYTKKHWIVHFKRVNVIVYELLLVGM